MSSQFKVCVECGSLFGPHGDKNFKRKKYCSFVCWHAAKKFAPKRADTMFWPKIDRSGGPEACWPYYRTDTAGYGRFAKQGPYAFAHRTAYLLTKGMIPDGMEVCHTCDVRNCCNPAHLFLATHDENMADCKAKKRHAWGERTWRNKLTAEQVQEIRKSYTPGRRWSGGGNARELAERYGVKANTITNIASGRTWKMLEPQ